MEEKEDTHEQEDESFCDWCGENPTYIGVYEDDSYNNEIFICKKCYEESYE